MKRYRLTRLAVSDMREIGRYTADHWGREQRSKYLRQLNARFAWLAANPRLEHVTPIRSHSVGSEWV